MTPTFPLNQQDLREVAAYAAASAADVLQLFEQSHPDDPRPRNAIAAAQTFAKGGKRTKGLRDAAWAALKAAKQSKSQPASQAARAAMCAASAAYLHPIPKATQIKHILGAPAHAAHAIELEANNAPTAAQDYLQKAARRATPKLIQILTRYPQLPPGQARITQLLTSLDNTLRQTPKPSLAPNRKTHPTH